MTCRHGNGKERAFKSILCDLIEVKVLDDGKVRKSRWRCSECGRIYVSTAEIKL